MESIQTFVAKVICELLYAKRNDNLVKRDASTILGGNLGWEFNALSG
jgi:hypothetical protein